MTAGPCRARLPRVDEAQVTAAGVPRLGGRCRPRRRVRRSEDAVLVPTEQHDGEEEEGRQQNAKDEHGVSRKEMGGVVRVAGVLATMAASL